MKQSDYPKELWIGDALWRVKFVRKLQDGRGILDGLCDPSETTIYLRMGHDRAERFKTLVHEILHAIEYEWKLELPHQIIYGMEEPIYRILVDNGIISA